MNNKLNRIISSLILTLLVATNFSSAIYVLGLTNPRAGTNLTPMLSDSYSEDFTTTAFEDGASTAFGWVLVIYQRSDIFLGISLIS